MFFSFKRNTVSVQSKLRALFRDFLVSLTVEFHNVTEKAGSLVLVLLLLPIRRQTFEYKCWVVQIRVLLPLCNATKMGLAKLFSIFENLLVLNFLTF